MFSPKLSPEKSLARIRLVVFTKKAKNVSLIPKNDVTEYYNKQLKSCLKTVSGFQPINNGLTGY